MDFQMQLPAGVSAMMERLQESGYAAYLVGGCVRDALSGLQPHDYDITTDATPDEIVELFGEQSCTYYGKAFGTVCVKRGADSAEITTFRTEGAYSDARHPDTVIFSKHVEDDLSRRDFTCNAIAYNPRTGLLDPYHGAEDLQKGILRAVGVPADRFHEDALRILRGMRFYARFGLIPEPATEQAMRDCAKGLEQISAERIFTELCGMVMGTHITEVLLIFPEILAVRIPEITPCIDFEQHSRYHNFTVWGHIARTVGNAVPDLTVRIAMLLHDIAKPDCFTQDHKGGHFRGHAPLGAKKADVILQRLRCDNKMRENVVQLIYWHRLTPKNMTQVRRMLGIMGEAQFRRYLAVLDADRISKMWVTSESRRKIDRAEMLLEDCLKKDLCCTIRQLAISGNDLIALGYEGKEIGQMLQAMLEAVISEEIPNTREALMEYAGNVSDI